MDGVLKVRGGVTDGVMKVLWKNQVLWKCFEATFLIFLLQLGQFTDFLQSLKQNSVFLI